MENRILAEAAATFLVERLGCVPLVASKKNCIVTSLRRSFGTESFSMAAAEPTPPTGDDKLLRLQARLGGRYSVLKPGRSVLHEGILFQQGESEHHDRGHGIAIGVLNWGHSTTCVLLLLNTCSPVQSGVSR